MSAYGVPVVIRENSVVLAGVDLTAFVPPGVVDLRQVEAGQWELHLTIYVVPE